MRIPMLIALLMLAACGSDPDKRTTPQEGKVTAKAVADVDAAAAEALQARPTPAAEPSAAPETPAESQ